MFMEPVSWLGVLIAVIVMTVVGFLWYSPVLFGTLWMRLSGHTGKDMSHGRSMTVTYLVNLASTLVMVYVLAQVLALLGITTAMGALAVSFWLWLGFFVTIAIHSVLWDGKPWGLFFINVGHTLITLILASLVLISF